MRDNAAEIWKWLSDGAYFYVCGDAARMATDVELALIDIVSCEGNLPTDAAKNFVAKLAKDRRYVRDVY